ncbi:hypothetical protein ACFV2N_39295 [Streptomyces sp. NPDC059680]|uniref:hypothetical protein n=1 Tax=Streptomyces sp. NPDC059680 TaxID=3346904 RepID=UPI00368C0229
MSAWPQPSRNGQRRTDADRIAAIALLNAIAKAVEDTQVAAVGRDQRIANLRDLAEAYALVTHDDYY